MASEAKPAASNVGKWDRWYRNLSNDRSATLLYGDPTTYLMAAAFLADIDEVEDWGCGTGGFRHYCVSQRYSGVDGSNTPFADRIVDLCTYRSRASGIVLRHVLEHNYEWGRILRAAVESFQIKFCLILFTPFAPETTEIAHNAQFGVDVPDLSFRREDIEAYFEGLRWKLLADINTRSQYGLEHVYFVWRP
jgi:hypothetical protein